MLLVVASDERRHHGVVHVIVQGDEGARVPARHGNRRIRARIGRRARRRRHRRREQTQIGRADHARPHPAHRPNVRVREQLFFFCFFFNYKKKKKKKLKKN